jgi:hypothetical protein
MMVSLFMRKAIVLTSSGIGLEKSYYLPDMSYGQFLVYDQLKPVYYVDFFDSSYKEMKEFIESNGVNAGVLVKKILQSNGKENLSVEERCWWKYRFGRELSVQYNLEPLPTSYWDNAKVKLTA